jgi:lipid A disaccharide synthetase
MNILIVCAETSANAYGVHLAKAFTNHGHRVFAMAGPQMAMHATPLLTIDPSQHSVGFWGWSFKRKVLRNMQLVLSNTSTVVDLAIIIDCAGMNEQVAHVLKRHGCEVSTFITPNFWLWNQKKKAKTLLGYSKTVVTIYQKEYAFYKQFSNANVRYLGHPLSLDVPPNPRPSNAPCRIGFFPGSRQSEVDAHLPIMAKLVTWIQTHTTHDCMVVCDCEPLWQQIRTTLTRMKVSVAVVPSMVHPIGYAFSAPGTNTLRLALMGVPTTIIGRLSPWVYPIAKIMIGRKIRWVGLPNIISNRQVFQEYIQPNDVQQMGAAMCQTLASESALSDMHQAMQAIRTNIQAPANYYDQLVGEFLDNSPND